VSDSEARPAEQAPVSAVQMAARLVACNPNQRLEHVLDGRPLVAGRSPSTDLRLHDRSVSRRHFEVRWVDGEYILRDVGSSNGTFVNGQRVRWAHLQNGDIIRAGLTELEFTTAVN
jgi:adenylate cyclase